MSETTEGSAAVTVVHSRACHFCDDARAEMTELALRYPLTVELVEAADPRGQALLAEHRSPMLPLVLIDGVFFSFGRLPRKKLAKLLEQRRVEAVA